MADVLPLPDLPAVLRQPKALRQHAQGEGWLLARQLLAPERWQALREVTATALVDLGLAHLDADGRPCAVPGRQLRGTGFDDPDWVLLQQRVQGAAAFRAVVMDPSLQSLLCHLFDTQRLTSCGDVVRVAYPASLHQTPPHQDAFYLRDPPGAWTAWTPLWPCALADGPLAVLPGSHRAGLRPHDLPVQGHLAAQVEAGASWRATPLQPGDVLLFSDLTLHRALPNLGPYVRVSVDLRFRRA